MAPIRTSILPGIWKIGCGRWCVLRYQLTLEHEADLMSVYLNVTWDGDGQYFFLTEF